MLTRVIDLSPTTLAWALTLFIVSSILVTSSLSKNFSNKRIKKRANRPAWNPPKKENLGNVLGEEVRWENDHYDAIIVGAGVAGSSLAYTLGKEGRKVLVLERNLSEPDRIVGELLQPGGYLKLKQLGMQDCLEGIDAQDVYGYALFKEGKTVNLPYPTVQINHSIQTKSGVEDSHTEPAASSASEAVMHGNESGSVKVFGKSFHHGRFIQKLRAKAASLPNVLLKEATVTSLIEENGHVHGVHYKDASFSSSEKEQEGEEKGLFAPITFVCDGCFSRLRKSLSGSTVDNPSSFVGLLLKDCPLPYPNHGHVILAHPSPILFYPISSCEVRCLVDIPGTRKLPSLANGEMKTYLKQDVAPQLPEELRECFERAVEDGPLKVMPNKIMPAQPLSKPGALLMGDAFNMRHPLTGGGMTVALSDICVLQDMLKPLQDFQDAEALCDYTKAFYTKRKPVASTINTLACALYKVFCSSPDKAMTEMRRACFDYLGLGGEFSRGPISLLSGLNPRPLTLVVHFFAVAFFGVGRLLLPFPTPSSIFLGFKLVQGAATIIIPIIRAEGIIKMFFPFLHPSYYKSAPL